MARPQVKSIEQQRVKLLEQIAIAAGAICIEVPRKPNKYARNAYVRWKSIERLRALLTDAGFDLEAARRRLEAKKVTEQANGLRPRLCQKRGCYIRGTASGHGPRCNECPYNDDQRGDDQA